MQADRKRPFVAFDDAERGALAPQPLTRAAIKAGAEAGAAFAAADPRLAGVVDGPA